MTVENLNVFVANTLADVAEVNENFETLRLAGNSIEGKIGDLGSLNTTQKSSVVAGINDAMSIMAARCDALIPPAGVIIAIVHSSVPDGYLLCNGAEISRTTYSKLFAAIGITFGGGDGSTTFEIPDFRGYFLRGYLGSLTAAIGTAQDCAAPNITGYLPNSYKGDALGAFYYTGYAYRGGEDEPTSHAGFDASRCNSAYGAANEVRPINHAVNFCIKY